MTWNREKNNNSQQDSDDILNEIIIRRPTYDSAFELEINEEKHYSGFVVRNTFAPPNPDSDGEPEE